MSDDETPKIKVFASDDNLKALGELLSNDSSRSIIYNLMTKEMYTNEISTKLDMRVSLVIHHLKKLEDLGLLEIAEKKIKRKGINHRFFKIKSNIFVVIDNDKKEIEEKGLMKKIFQEGIKFAGIGTAFVFSFMMNVKYNSTINYPVPFETYVNNNFDDLTVYVIPLIIVIIGLVIERILFGIKKRKRD